MNFLRRYRVGVERGDFVKEGALLLETDGPELKASGEQARAALVSSQAALEVARSTFEGLGANLENQRANLVKARAVLANDTRQAERMKKPIRQGHGRGRRLGQRPNHGGLLAGFNGHRRSPASSG